MYYAGSPHCTVQYSAALHYSILYCVILYCVIMY